MKTKWQISEAEIAGAIIDREYLGLCRTCGAVADGVEPDARHYHCAACDSMDVYGLEELLLMGELDIKGDRP